MSSAVAMNRRVSKQNGESVPDFQTNVSNNMPVRHRPRQASGTPIQQCWTLSNNMQDRRMERPRQAGGTPIQQCWTIMNFHETRLNNIEDQLHFITRHIRSGTSESNDNNLQILLQRMDRLEKENVSLRQFNQREKSSKKSMSLEVSEE